MTLAEGQTPYKELIINNVEEIEPLLAQMEQWSIISNTFNYVQYGRHPECNHSLGIRAVNNYGKESRYKRGKRLSRVRFWPNTRHVKGRLFRHA